ncbi:uncharacterized protein LOC102717510 [Oryza brachyantha]|uniref:uncharacterized protein LOC102717510 n=1 Tax=Oryza brachyantha TaxID=4533 RepID=UPI001AD9DA0A|nr:uncharacterized protein LOC102717510 [Oryza brachyantha]
MYRTVKGTTDRTCAEGHAQMRDMGFLRRGGGEVDAFDVLGNASSIAITNIRWRQTAAAGSPGDHREMMSGAWWQSPFVGQQQQISTCGGLPLMPCPYNIVPAHHYLIKQNQMTQGWRGGQAVQQDDAAVIHSCSLGMIKDKGQQRRLPAAAGGHDDETARMMRSSSVSGFARAPAAGWAPTTWSPPPPPTPQATASSASTAMSVAAARMKQQQPAPSRVPSLEISLGRQGWQSSSSSSSRSSLGRRQRQRSVESSSSKELTLLKCL